MGDIVFGDKNVLGNNSRIINIEMKNYFGFDSNKDTTTTNSENSDTEETEFEEMGEETLQPIDVSNNKGADYSASIKECFRNANKFVQKQVLKVVNKYYWGSAANLALIEITLFDHNLLLKRNKHTTFVKSLMAWGIIPLSNEEAIGKIANGMAYKMRALPKSGYKEWNGNNYVNDKKTCIDIGKVLDSTIPYSRKKED